MKLRLIYAIGVLALCLVITTSCDQTRLEKALQLAGDNRPELEKVLEYYSQKKEDSLKFKAAVFLIENMPGHMSYIQDSIVTIKEEYNKIVASNVSSREKKRLLEELSEKYKLTNDCIIEDVRIMSADYLIKNIDISFDLWTTSRYAIHLDFDQFCNLLLPYKCAELQELDDWKSELKGMFTEPLLELPYNDENYNNVCFAATIINKEMRAAIGVNHVHDYNGIKIINSFGLSHIPFGICEDYSLAAVAVMRSNGIPAFVEYLPLWAGKNSGHGWHSVLNENGVSLPCPWNLESLPGDTFFPDRRMSKVFRRTYARDIRTEEYYNKSKFKYEFDTFKEDVTSSYIATNNLHIPVDDRNLVEKYAYIAVFNNTVWSVVDFGTVKRGVADFLNIGRGIAYQVLGYDGKKLVPISDPFILHLDGRMEFCKADDASNVHDVTLRRKFPKSLNTAMQEARIIGGEIHASNDEDFNTYDFIFRVDSLPLSDVAIDTTNSYRYWRYYYPGKYIFAISELQFYTPGSTEYENGDIISSKELTEQHVNSVRRAFDGNQLTSYTSSNSDNAWVGLDFGRPVTIERIKCVPRSDDNAIRPGDTYELKYWNGSWISLGMQTAETSYLTYHEVPIDAILLLSNLSRGKEESIFTYSNGKQSWW